MIKFLKSIWLRILCRHYNICFIHKNRKRIAGYFDGYYYSCDECKEEKEEKDRIKEEETERKIKKMLEDLKKS